MGTILELNSDAGECSQRALGNSECQLLLREARAAAGRLARRLGLSVHERDDIQQELIIDALVRLRAFNPARGSLGAFVGTIISRRIGRLARQLYRRRAIEGLSLDRDRTEDCVVSAGADTRIEF